MCRRTKGTSPLPATISKMTKTESPCWLMAHALDHANVNVTVVQEVKLKDPTFAPRTGFRYTIHTMAKGPRNCRRISLLVLESDSFGVKEVKV